MPKRKNKQPDVTQQNQQSRNLNQAQNQSAINQQQQQKKNNSGK